MKFPEHSLSMEAGLPSSVHKWLTQELEQLGIDSLIYTRYIISLLLHQGIEDLDWYDSDEEFCSKSKPEKFKKRGKKQDQNSRNFVEEAKKSAVIDCLSAVSEEKTGIKSLVEELCTKLKEKETKTSSHNQITPSTSDSSEDSGTENQNPVERYYAAFPSLNSQELKDTPSNSPTVSVWKKNPFDEIKSSSTPTTPRLDGGSPSEDLEVRKINVSCKIAVPKHRKQKKNPNRNNNRSSQEKKKIVQKPPLTNTNFTGQKHLKEYSDIQNWPPGFAKMDPYVLQNIDMYGNKLVLRSDIKRPQDEICTQVETILKRYLLPAPYKAYKELQDVDTECQFEQRERVKKVIVKDEGHDGKFVSSPLIDVGNDMSNVACSLSRESSISNQSCGDCVSPELREQESWYTQPIDVIFLGQDEEPQESKLRLYKRSSLPSSSPGASTSGDYQNPDSYVSTSSSPVCEQKEDRSTPDSDFILQRSDLIPSWLTEQLLADFDDESDSAKDDDLFSFKASSPNLSMDHSGSDVFRNLDVVINKPHTQVGKVETPRSYRSGSSTPTCDSLLPVSLLDLDYLSSLGREFEDGFFFDSLAPATFQGRCSFSSWQSRVLLDNLALTSEAQAADPQFILNENPCWQSFGIGGSCMAQLWDVNMQKRTKVSSTWEPHFTTAEKQVWSSENVLIFHNGMAEREQDLSGNKNTLIPHISIDIYDDPPNEYDCVQDDDDEDVVSQAFPPNFDRSVSLGDMYRWVENSQKVVDPQLSKSFDLVPSEYSAFCDVPRKLVHVHSEPNLVQFRQDFLDVSQTKATSPNDNLFFSPKTHFRPITPAYAPELSSSATKAQYVLNDLFGGLPSTKTPYQQFHMNDGESEEESFIPKFKLKNFSKSIQTGEGFDNADSSDNEDDMMDSEMRDTPETLTLGMIEDVMGGDKDEDMDYLIPITEDFDTANTDSAYETDYGLPNNENGQESLIDGCHGCQEQATKGKVLTGEIGDKRPEIGNVIDYTVKSFKATFPHTQDWPDMSKSLQGPVDSGQYWNCDWQSRSYHGYPIKNTWSIDNFGSSRDADDELRNQDNPVSTDESDETDLFDHWISDQYAYDDQTEVQGQCVNDLAGNLFFEENCEAVYPVTWSSFDKDDDNVLNESSLQFNPEANASQCFDDVDPDASMIDNLFASSSTELEDGVCEEAEPNESQAVPCQRLKVFSSQFFSMDDFDFEEKGLELLSSQCFSADDVDTEGTGLEILCDEMDSAKVIGDIRIDEKPVKTEDGDSGIFCQHIDNDQCNLDVLGHGYEDYFRVKLVYKDNIQEPSTLDRSKRQVSKGYGVKPLPDDAKLSSELEREWLDHALEMSKEECLPSSYQRKPCSFFLEGNCRRTDCKFAHDIANITCRFWEEGGCFKGPLCPFLHGYPSIMSSNEKSSNKFDLKGEEFPELSTSFVSPGNTKKERSVVAATNNRERATRTPNRQTTGTVSRREKHRKQNSRRHSNKENRIELYIVDKCSSSI